MAISWKLLEVVTTKHSCGMLPVLLDFACLYICFGHFAPRLACESDAMEICWNLLEQIGEYFVIDSRWRPETCTWYWSERDVSIWRTREALLLDSGFRED